MIRLRLVLPVVRRQGVAGGAPARCCFSQTLLSPLTESRPDPDHFIPAQISLDTSPLGLELSPPGGEGVFSCNQNKLLLLEVGRSFSYLVSFTVQD